MTTPTPTSNTTGAPASPGLPDASVLTRLANELFAALPGTSTSGISLPLNTAPEPSLNPPSVSPTDGPAFASRAPSLSPSATTPSGVPDNVAATAPAANSRVGAPAISVPQAYAAALPAVDRPPTPVAIPSTPYYFIGESSAYPSALPKGSESPQSSGQSSGDQLTAQPYALPGDSILRALLPGIGTGSGREATSAPAGTPAFYFLDNALPGHKDMGILPVSRAPFDVYAIRRDFPILSERVNGQQLVWFDNAATTQKPQAVIDRLAYFYAHENSNIHRAAHELAARATDAYEAARSKVARFLGAASADEVIFVRGATEGINLLAQSYGRQNLREGDEIIVSELEHHANIVPWQQVAAEKGAKLRIIPVDDSGQVLLNEYQKLLGDRTKIVSIAHVSNALGTIVPVKLIIEQARRVGAKVVVDGAQAVSHMRVNVQALDADFYVFSGHKVFGPTGIGVVYGKSVLLEAMPPWQGGGNMISDVTFEKTSYQKAPTRFEAGTGNIADAVALGAAIDYLDRIGLENVARYEHDLLVYATQGLKSIPGLRLIGTAPDKASVASFVLDGHSPEDVGKALSAEGIAVRAGHHCAQPILRRFGLEASVRPSLAFYNTCEEVDRLIAVLRRLTAGKGTRTLQPGEAAPKG